MYAINITWAHPEVLLALSIRVNKCPCLPLSRRQTRPGLAPAGNIESGASEASDIPKPVLFLCYPIPFLTLTRTSARA